MLKILQTRLQQYVNCEIPDVQAGFRKDRRTKDQIADICWIIEKAKEFQKNIYFSILKSRDIHYFANKGPSSQSYGFSSSHVWV